MRMSYGASIVLDVNAIYFSAKLENFKMILHVPFYQNYSKFNIMLFKNISDYCFGMLVLPE